MNVIIVGGNQSADYIIKTFTRSSIPFIVVNGSKEIANKLSRNNNIEVYCGPTNKLATYEDLQIKNYDLVVALEDDDIRNYIIVALLKKFFNVKRAICSINDPHNYSIFKELGVDSPISNSYLLAEQIINNSDIGELTKSVKLEDGKVAIIDISLKKGYKVVGQTLTEIQFPVRASVNCICRGKEIIIPDGTTRLLENDRVIITLSAEDQRKIISFIKQK